MKNLYQIRNLNYSRLGKTNFKLEVNELYLPSECVVAIIGSSGSGKTTLMNILSGLELPDQSSELLDLTLSDQVYHLVGDKHQNFPAQRIGRVFQQGHLLASASVASNIAVAAQAAGRSFNRRSLIEYLSMAGLGDQYLDRRAWQLSGGEAQRVSIARAMISEPEIIFADEPTSNADPELALELMRYLKKWVEENKKNRSLIWVTHDYRLAAEVADYIIVLKTQSDDKGNVQSSIYQGKDNCLKVNPKDSVVIESWARRNKNEFVSLSKYRNETKSDTEKTKNFKNIQSSKLEAQLASAALYGRRSATKYFERLTHLTSLSNEPQVYSNFWSNFIARVRAFDSYSLLFRGFLAALLIWIALTSIFLQNNYFERQFNNAEFCNISVSGTPATSYSLTPSLINDLNEQPWLSENRFAPHRAQNMFEEKQELNKKLDSTPINIGCSVHTAVWPRYSERFEVGLADLESTDHCEVYRLSPGLLSSVQVMLMHRKEPILSSIPLIGSNNNESIASNFRSDKSHLSMVLSKSFVDLVFQKDIEYMNNIDSICLKLGNDILEVDLEGISPHLPADLYYSYDAILPLKSVESRIGEYRNYSSSNIYFDSENFKLIKKFLDDISNDISQPGLNYDPDIFKKFSESINLNNALKMLTYLVLVIVIAANVLNLYSAYFDLVERNNRALAVQISLNISRKFIFGFIIKYAKTIFVLSAVLTFVFGVFVLFCFHLHQSVSLEDLRIAFCSLLISILLLFFFSLISLLLGVKSVMKNIKNNLAETLQSGI